MSPTDLVLSLYPSVKGCGYVFFEDALSPFDWGIAHAVGKAKSRRILLSIEKLIARYQPVVIVLEDWLDIVYERSERIVALYEAIVALAKQKLIAVVTIPMRKVREYFAYRNAIMKYDIALHIAKIIPAFSYQLPPIRKAWNAASRRQALYDAAAVGLAYYSFAEERGSANLGIIPSRP